MAIQLEKENNKFNIYMQHFLIDSAADLQNIEKEYVCHQGDKAELPNGSYYLRHSDDYQGERWELVKNCGCGGGSDLPEVSSEDNGKVLGVVDGQWAVDSKGYDIYNATYIIYPEETVVTTYHEEEQEFYCYLDNFEEPIRVGDVVTVIFDGVNYTLTAVYDDGEIILEDYETPFCIIYDDFDNMGFVLTPDAGTHTISMTKEVEEVTTTDDFDLARGYSVKEQFINIVDEQTVYTGNEEPVLSTIEPETRNSNLTKDSEPAEEETEMSSCNIRVNPIVNELYIGLKCIITFNGVSYTKTIEQDNDCYYLGELGGNPDVRTIGPDFSNYPFFITFENNDKSKSVTYIGTLFTEIPTEVTIEVKAITNEIITTNDFNLAVNSVISGTDFDVVEVNADDNGNATVDAEPNKIYVCSPDINNDLEIKFIDVGIYHFFVYGNSTLNLMFNPLVQFPVDNNLIATDPNKLYEISVIIPTKTTTTGAGPAFGVYTEYEVDHPR